MEKAGPSNAIPTTSKRKHIRLKFGRSKKSPSQERAARIVRETVRRNLKSGWTSLATETQTQLRSEDILDGVVVISDTMRIGRNCGEIHLLDNFSVRELYQKNLKGFETYFTFQTKHVFEIPIAFCGGCTLSALITSGKLSKATRPEYKALASVYKKAIRTAILSLNDNSMSKKDVIQRADGVVCIYKTDFEDVCDALPNVLANLSADQNYQNCFPPHPMFFWKISHLGESITYQENALEVHKLYDTAINLEGRYKVAIHCAKDYILENNALFWITAKLFPVFQTKKPKDIYFPALLPGLGNIQHVLASPNYPAISHIQYYSKVFAPAHRDQSQIFKGGQVTNTLFRRYCRALQGKGAKDPPGRPTPLQRVLQSFGRFGSHCENLHDSCHGTTPARLEVVWSSSDSFESISAAIKSAFQYSNENAFPRLFQPDMLQNIPSSDLVQHIKIYTETFGTTISKLSNMVMGLTEAQNFWIVDVTKLIPAEEFIKARVAEAILHFVLSGRLARETPTSIHKYLGLTPAFLASHVSSLQSCKWPFRGITQTERGFKINDMTHLESTLKLNFTTNEEILCNKFVESRRKFIMRRNEETGVPVRSKDDALNVIQIAADVIQFFQMDKPAATDLKLHLKETFLHKISACNEIKHCSSTAIVDKLSKCNNDKNFKFVAEIIERLKMELEPTINVEKELAKRIDTLVAESGFPFRVTLNKTDYVSVISKCEFPAPTNIKNAFIRSLVDLNALRIPSVTGGNISRLIKVFFEEGNRHPNMKYAFPVVATAIQNIFDDNELGSRTAESSTGLAQQLIQTWRNDRIDYEIDDDGDYYFNASSPQPNAEIPDSLMADLTQEYIPPAGAIIYRSFSPSPNSSDESD